MRIVIDSDVAIPLRDGVVTRGDVYRPSEAQPLPAIVSRTPYGKSANRGVALMPDLIAMAQRGYAVVITDVRGRLASDGDWEPFVNEADDGYDTLEWVATQPWCNGRTGMVGISYFGATAMAAAATRPPSLRCAIPILTADDYHDGWIFSGGVLQLGFAANWAMLLTATDPARQTPAAMGAVIGAVIDPDTLARRPLSAIPGIAGTGAQTWWMDWLTHEYRDTYWDATRPSVDYSRFTIPMLHVGGWFDLFGSGTIRNFRGLSAANVPGQHLVMGPWCHGGFDRTVGEVDFGLFANPLLCGMPECYNTFLDAHLKDQPAEQPAVRYFLMGANEWRIAPAWPPPEAQPTQFFLHGQGQANSAGGDGRIDPTCPADEPADHFIYDPADPVPTQGGAIYHCLAGGLANLGGPRDQRAVEARADVLCYTGAIFSAPMIATGPVTLLLWATTDAPDTDWTAKLVDVAPDGVALGVCDGIMRAACRHGVAAADAPPPGQAAAYTIELGHTAYQFAAGHRMRIEISSSNAPRFRPSPNTGEALASAMATRIAAQTVHHDRDRPSCLTLGLLVAR